MPSPLAPNSKTITCAYLCNTHGKGDRRHKLHLRRADQETLMALVDGKELPNGSSPSIRENLDFFEQQLSKADLELVYRGIKKLVAVDVCLTRGQDDPQMIFESLNSTGLDLTQADLIRNFVLMRQDEQLQTQLYKDYWQPIELAFGMRYRTDFDKFMRDFLTLELKPSSQFKADEIYQQFRSYFYSTQASVGDILAKLRQSGSYYVSFSLGQESNAKLKEAFRRLRLLVEVASSLVLRLYDCYSRVKTLTLDDFVEAVALLESYVFRQALLLSAPYIPVLQTVTKHGSDITVIVDNQNSPRHRRLLPQVELWMSYAKHGPVPSRPEDATAQ